jgi:autotransporter-associated beta strand protein
MKLAHRIFLRRIRPLFLAAASFAVGALASAPLENSLHAAIDSSGSTWWNNSNTAQATGTISVTGSTTTTIQFNLTDRADAASITSGWDGKSLTKEGTGTLTLTSGYTYNYTGSTTINNGTLELTASNLLTGTTGVYINTSAKLYLVANGISQTLNSLTGTGTVSLATSTTLNVNVAAGTTNTFDGLIDEPTNANATLNKLGTGTLVLTQAQRFAIMTVSEGTFRAGAADILKNNNGSITIVADATFDLNGFDQAVPAIEGAGNILLGAKTLTVSYNYCNSTFAGVISGTGGITVQEVGRSLTLTGENTYTGSTTLATNAKLIIGTGGTTGSIAGDVILGNGASVEFNRSNNSTFAGDISGTGNFKKSGAGKLTLTGDVTLPTSGSYGGVDITAGTLAITGSLTAREIALRANTTLEIDASGQVTLPAATGGLYYASNSTLALHFKDGGLTRAVGTPFITGKNNTLQGALIVTDAPAYSTVFNASSLPLQDEVIIHTTDGITGNFSSTNITSTGTKPDYLVNAASIINSNNDYAVGYRLAWDGSAANAHGSFTIATGESFIVDTPLANRSGTVFASGWDGATLLKRGTGTLVVSAAANVTTATVAAGVLRLQGTQLHTAVNIYVGTPLGTFDRVSTSRGAVLHLDNAAGVSLFAASAQTITLHLTGLNFIELNKDVTGKSRLEQITTILAEIGIATGGTDSTGGTAAGTNLVKLTGWTGEEIASIDVDGTYSPAEIATLDRVLVITTGTATADNAGTPPAYPLGAPTGKADDPLNGGSGNSPLAAMAAPVAMHTYVSLGIAPEPSTYALCAAPLLAALLYLRRRKRYR